MIRRSTTLVVAAVALATAALTGTAHAAQEDGTVTILHGVPDFAVDVYANDDVLISDFAPGDQFGPTALPAGDYDVALRAAGDPADSDPALAATVTVPAGVNATAIAHLDATGSPTLTVFVNDLGAIAAGEARLVVRHTAAFGAVDVLAGGDAIVSSLTNPDEAALDVPADSYDVAVTAAGDPETEAFRGELPLAEGTAYLVHAIGDPAAGSFDLLVQTIDGLHTAPTAVDTGSGGLAADTGSVLPGSVALLAVAALLLFLARPVLSRRR